MLNINDSSIQNDLSVIENNTTSGAVDPTLIFGPQRDPLYIVLPITVIYTLIFVTGLFGNVFTCIVIIRNKSMHTATNYYLFSLAVSDLLLLVSGMPQEVYSIWSKWPYVFGAAFCLIRGLAAETSTNASVLTITLFTVERYLAICHPFQSYRMSKLSRAVRHIIILWLVSMALALPQALQFGIRKHRGVTMCLQTRVIIDHSFEISTFLFFFTPMMLITVLYSLIGLRLHQTRLAKATAVRNDQEQNMLRTDNKMRRKVSQSTRRVVKMLVAVVVAFFVCWAPFHAQRLVAIYGTSADHHENAPGLLVVYSILTYASGVFYYMSTCINPILYHIMSHKFRDAFKNTMLRCCGISKRSTIQRCSYTALAFQRNPTSSGTDNSGNSIRNETPGFRNERRHYGDNPLISKSITSLSDSIRVGLQPREQCYASYYDHCTESRSGDPDDDTSGLATRQGKTNIWLSFHRPEPSFQIDVHRRNSRQDSISNSSLKDVKKEDLEDELAAYVREMKLRVLQREKDYG